MRLTFSCKASLFLILFIRFFVFESRAQARAQPGSVIKILGEGLGEHERPQALAALVDNKDRPRDVCYAPSHPVEKGAHPGGGGGNANTNWGFKTVCARAGLDASPRSLAHD